MATIEQFAQRQTQRLAAAFAEAREDADEELGVGERRDEVQ